MDDVKKIAMTLYHSYEDHYLDKEKRKIFEDLFDRYLTKVDTLGTLEVYDAAVKLAEQYPGDFEALIKTLREHSLLPAA